MKKSIEQLTKLIDWTVDESKESLHENLVLSALLRIATATEKMAIRYNDLIEERDKYKQWYTKRRENHECSIRTINALKGHITRLKKKIEELKNSK